MGRPKGINIKNFSQYDKLHTNKTKMYSGVQGITLYPIKETANFYLSCEVWAYCASKFKAKKSSVTLSVDIPVITDEKTLSFLTEECWGDWVDREIASNDTNMIEAIAMLKKVFPDKKPVYFYELDSIIAAYYGGTFISYDDNGNVVDPTKNAIKMQKYYTHKYNRHCDAPHVNAAREKYRAEKDETLKDAAHKAYYALQEEYVFEHNNLTDVFINIGEHAVCYPVAFTHETAEWYKEEHGKKCSYSHIGEIFFVVTNDTVYFEIKRHY